jgi:hypothetical protein
MFLFSPITRRYSNLTLEATSIDTGMYPVIAVYVSVKGRDGRPVYGLDRSNFAIIEDGALMTRHSADYLKNIAPSASFAICIDRSKESMEHERNFSWAADFILKKMRTNDAAEVINYHSETWSGARFDWSRRRTQRAIKKSEHGNGKDISKALYQAVGDLAPRISRRAAVVITDGTLSDDSFESYSVREIIHYARTHFVPIYVISFKKPDKMIEKIAADTGGRVYRPVEIDSLRGLYDLVKRSEEYRYVLVYSTYKPKIFSGFWSDIAIEVDHRGEKGVESVGYFVP